MTDINTPPSPRPVVSVDLDTDELMLGQLIGTTETLFRLLREVAASVVPTGGVRWIVDELSMASPVHLAVRPVGTTAAVSAQSLGNLADVIVGGLATVQNAPQRPAYFTDRTLEIARRLGSDTAVRLRLSGASQSAPFFVTSQLVANVDSILGQAVTAIGTIEGTLEAFNVHGANRYFNVYDALTGERVRCDFGHRIEVRDIGMAAVRRVAVHGQIVYRTSGEIVKVIANSLYVFPEEADLPQSEAVRGILEA